MAESWLRVRWYPSIGKETAREDPIRSPMAEASSLAKVVLPEPGQPAIPTQTLRESLRLLSTRREAVFLRLFLCLRRVKGGGLSQFDPCVGVVMGRWEDLLAKSREGARQSEIDAARSRGAHQGRGWKADEGERHKGHDDNGARRSKKRA